MSNGKSICYSLNFRCHKICLEELLDFMKLVDLFFTDRSKRNV